jgi:hypothetical protein
MELNEALMKLPANCIESVEPIFGNYENWEVRFYYADEGPCTHDACPRTREDTERGSNEDRG